MLGRVRTPAEQQARVEAVDAAAVQATFARMLAQPPAVAVVGKLRPGAGERFMTRLSAA